MKKRKDSRNRVLKSGEYERPNGTYEYRWSDRRGKRHVIYEKTLSELRNHEEKLIHDSYDGINIDGTNLTINELYEKWLRLKRGIKENTLENYKYMYEQFVKDIIGNLKIAQVRKSDIRQFYNTLHDTRGIKVTTLVNIQTVLHQIIQIAVDDDIVMKNPSDNALTELIRAYGNESENRKALTMEEQTLLLGYLASQSCPYHHWYPLIVTLTFTGMRIGELSGLTWDDVDFDNNIITIDHNAIYFCSRKESEKHGNQKWAITSPKTDTGNRRIPLLPIVKDALMEEKAYQEKTGITCKQVIDGYTNFIFVNRFGYIQHQGTVNRALKRIIRDCNINEIDKAGGVKDDLVLLPNFSCHSLRHTMATRMNEAGVNDRVRMSILGHKDLLLTQVVYTDSFDDFNKKELNKLTQTLTKD